jgi:hypothetical protein
LARAEQPFDLRCAHCHFQGPFMLFSSGLTAERALDLLGKMLDQLFWIGDHYSPDKVHDSDTLAEIVNLLHDYNLVPK